MNTRPVSEYIAYARRITVRRYDATHREERRQKAAARLVAIKEGRSPAIERAKSYRKPPERGRAMPDEMTPSRTVSPSEMIQRLHSDNVILRHAVKKLEEGETQFAAERERLQHEVYLLRNEVEALHREASGEVNSVERITARLRFESALWPDRQPGVELGGGGK